MKRIGAAGLAVVAVLLAGSNPTHGQSAPVNGAPGQMAPGSSGKRAMTFADLMAMKRVSDPQISPSGRWVLFSVTEVDLAKNTKVNHLWVVPLGTSRTADVDGGGSETGGERQITFGAGESFGRFAPDGTRVSYTQNPGAGESFARIAVAAWDEKTGTTEQAKPLMGVSGDADGAVWSPDSKRLMFTTQVWPECSVKFPTHDDSAVVNGPPGAVAGIEISGTRNVAAWRNGQPAAWGEEDACDKAKDEAAEKSPVKAQVWDGLLYRHWDHWTGAKRTHLVVADVSDPTHDDRAVVNGAPGDTANPPKLRVGGAPGSAGAAIRDVTTARDVGDAETPTWMLGGPQEYAWAPDSKEIAYVANLDPVPATSTNNDVFTLRVDEGGSGDAARPVKVSTSPGSDDEPEYSPDGRWLAFRSQRQAGFESDRERLMLSERCGGNRDQRTGNRGCGGEWDEPRELLPKFDGWVDEFTWASDSKTIYLASALAGEEDILAVDAAGRAIKFLAPTGGEHGDLRISPDGKEVVATKMRILMPAEIVRRVPDAAQSAKDGLIMTAGLIGPSLPTLYASELPITHLNDRLVSQLDISPLEPFWFTGAEGTKVEGFLVKPPGFDATKKYPVKFLMHGGPQTAWGDAWSYRWNWELMAANGYVVIGINRRGSTGYGQKFVDEVSGDWGGRAYEDLMKGLDYAEAQYPFIDKTRECALGASYGGYMADWVLTHTQRFQCIVTHDGLYDPAAAYGTTEELWFPEWEFRRPEDYPKGWDGFGGYKPMGSRNPTHAQSARVNGPPGKATTGILPPRSAQGQDDGGKQATTTTKATTKATTGVLRSAQDDGEKQATAKTTAKATATATTKTNAGGSPLRSAQGQDDGGREGGNPDPTHDDKAVVNGAPRADGHAAEPWRYAGLAASEDPFRRWSPKEFIQNAKTPTLVIHSQRDYRLDVSQGFALYTALQRQGVPSRFLYFPDEGHWVLKPQNAELWNAVVSDWCDRWTHSGRYAPR